MADPVLGSVSKTMKGIKPAFHAVANQHKTTYGILLYDDELILNFNSIVSFDAANATTFENVLGLGGKIPSAGAYAKGKYYIAFTKTVSGREIPSELFKVDLETKKVEMVGTLTGFDYMINDLSYDYSTDKLYAIAKLNNGNSALYTIDLTYASSQKVAELDRHFFTLACSYNGQLYGVSRNGMFCKIDKVSGRVAAVGSTQMQPSYLQSMEFDHTDKTLYWAVSSIDETTCMATIDVQTGFASPISLLGNNAEIAGLYIPFTASADNTPSAVGNFSVQAGPDGACNATLKWRNPVETFAGAPLDKLTKVEIYRNEQLVLSKNNPTPGEEETFTDRIADHTGLTVTYKIIPVNENGNGVVKETTLFVGKDVPGAPTGLQLTKDGVDRITLSWEAPVRGINNGWTDLASLTYKVVRLPDQKIIRENLKETTCTDTDISPVNSYAYQVISINAAGVGGESQTPGCVLGPQNTIPYFCDFETDEVTNSWTVINGNNDNRTWNREYSRMAKKYAMTYQFSNERSADDWLVAHSCLLEKGQTYRLSFLYSSLSPNNLRFTLGRETTPQAMTLEIADYKGLKSSDFVKQAFEFTVTSTDNYHLGIQIYSEKNSSWFYLTDISIEPVVPVNLAAVSLQGNQHPITGKTYAYNLTVRNKGTEPQSGFTLSLKDGATGAELAKKPVTETLQPEEQKTFALDWTPGSLETASLTGEVACPGDPVSKDNVTRPLTVNVQPEGSAEIVRIGTAGDYSKYHPFNFYETKSAAMNIYTRDEIGQPGGVIESILYSYNNIGGKEIANTPVKIYLGNTGRTDTKAGWLDEDEMVLVYDGTVSIATGANQLVLDLDRYFVYTGANLAVLTVQSMEKVYYDGIQFPYYVSPAKENKALLWTGYSTPFDFTVTGKQGTSNSSVTFTLLCDGGKISGKVEDESGTPLEGATVTLSERKTTVTTDYEGHYTFDYIPDGTYTLQCTLHGYPDVQSSHVVVSGRQAVERNIRMTNLPAYRVEGSVFTPGGRAVPDATVSLTGYDNLEVTTSADGRFIFDNVLSAEGYQLAVYADWYKVHRQTLDVKDDNLDLGEITLDYLVYRPVNARTAEDSGGNLQVSWDTPDQPMTLRKDDGTVSGQCGISPAGNRTVLGTVYRTPTVVTDATWLLTREGGPHRIVSLFIFDLDESGRPINHLLYSIRDLKNTDDQWNTFTLPEPVQAPRGFMVALNYPGFLALGQDSGESIAYPFEKEVHAFASDYENGQFDYLEDKGLTGNLMIRASGYVLADNEEPAASGKPAAGHAAEKPGFWTYKVWRLADKDLVSPGKWTLLTTTALTETTFADPAWKTLPPGVYRYAVRMEYPGGRLSEPVLTPCAAHRMETAVTVNVKTNDKSGSAAGASVTLTNEKGKALTATVGANNQALFASLWKDRYDIALSLDGFETVRAKVDFTLEDQYVTTEYLLKERIVTPYNLEVAEKENGQALFSWNTTADLSDDFESYEDFAINPAGTLGWQYLDLDGGFTYAFDGSHFPGEGSPMAFMVFNPSSTTPPSDEIEPLRAHSGSKFLACFAAQYGNNDFLISPELNFVEDFTFRFYAKSYSNYYGYTDPFNVGYSLDGTALEDFVWLAEKVVPGADEWKEYAYTIPAGARYVTLNCVSEDGFVLMIDDLFIGKARQHTLAGEQPEEPVVSYEVYLDGRKVSETTGNAYLFTGLAEGKHVAGVKAVYYSGASGVVTREFGSESGIATSQGQAFRAYPNPVRDLLNVEGSYTRLELQDISGRCIARYQSGTQTIDVSGLAEGIYLLVVIDENAPSRRSIKIKVID